MQILEIQLTPVKSTPLGEGGGGGQGYFWTMSKRKTLFFWMA